MITKPLLCLILCLNFSIVRAQYSMGSKLTAQGENGIADHDVWMMQANQAGITQLPKPVFALDYSENLISNQIRTIAAAFVFPVQSKYYLGASFQRYGIDVYQESKFGFAYAQKFGEKLALSINQNYHQFVAEKYFAKKGYSIDAGLLYQWTNNILLGIHYQNIGNLGYAQNLFQKFPSYIALGTQFILDDKVSFNASYYQYLNHEKYSSLRIGCNYQIINSLAFRAGIASFPFTYYGGFGLNYSKIQFDFAFTEYATIGTKPQITIAYEL